MRVVYDRCSHRYASFDSVSSLRTSLLQVRFGDGWVSDMTNTSGGYRRCNGNPRQRNTKLHIALGNLAKVGPTMEEKQKDLGTDARALSPTYHQEFYSVHMTSSVTGDTTKPRTAEHGALPFVHEHQWVCGHDGGNTSIVDYARG